MASKKVFTVPFRRKRKGKTDYKKRLSLLKSHLPRFVVRKSNKHIITQLVHYSDEGDVVVESSHSRQLKEFGWKFNTGNIPAAYLTGLLLGKKTEGKTAVLDLGLQTPKRGSKLFAALKGAVDGGLKINFSEEVVPSEERLSGKHMTENTKEKSIQENFEKTKQKILSGKNKNGKEEKKK